MGRDDEPLPELQKAEERGGTAWRRGAPTSSDPADIERALKQIKGILNKLTPENFNKLTEQVVGILVTTSIEGVKAFIPVLFEKAVAEPAFCNLYSKLCVELNQQLGDLGRDASGRKLDFKKLLLYTCEDEFDAILEAKEKDKGAAEGSEEHRRFKGRTLGTVRLLGELYNNHLIREVVLTKMVLPQLLDGNQPSQFTAANEVPIEAACQLLAIAGKELDAEPKVAGFLAAYLAGLERNAPRKELTSRLRFLIRDVLELRSNAWVPRKEVYTAKTIEEVRKEAFESLNMQMPAAGAPGGLALPGAGGGDGILFPEFEEAAQEGPVYGTRGVGKSDEELARMVANIFEEYKTHGQWEESLGDVYELGRPDWGAGLVHTGLQCMMDALSEKDVTACLVLLVTLMNQQLATEEQIVEGYRRHTDMLLDLSMDVPKAPELLGRAFGATLGQHLLHPQSVQEVLSSMDCAESRRRFLGPALEKIREDSGEEHVLPWVQHLAGNGVEFRTLLEADPEMEQHLESTDEYLASIGLQGVL